MSIDITEHVSRKEWLRYLHVEGDADDSLEAQLEAAEKMLRHAARPKAVYRVMDITDVPQDGFSVKKHLEGCDRVAVMALTLGIGVDNLIKKTQVTDMAMAVIIDSGASVLVDQLCGEYEKMIDSAVDGYLTPRFSPGYGDFPVETQSDIIKCVDGQRKIGLNVTADSLMIPRKSVTALIGIADHPVKGRLATCGECVLAEKCILKKEGKFCGE